MLHFAIFAVSVRFFVLSAFLACLAYLLVRSLFLHMWSQALGNLACANLWKCCTAVASIRCRGHWEMQCVAAHASGLRNPVHDHAASQPNNRNARKAMKPPDTREDHVCLVAFSTPVCPGCLGFSAKQLTTTCARAVAGGCILAALACLMRLRTCPPWGKTSRAASAGHVCQTMDFVMIPARQIRELASPIHRTSNHPANAAFRSLLVIAASIVYCTLSLCIWCCRLFGRNMDYESRLLASTISLRGGR